jgi:acetyl esterase/lipase
VSSYGPDPVIVPGTTRDPDRHGEWWVPPEPGDGPLPTVVLVHGGFWKPGYDRSLEDAVAAHLAGRGFLVWNIDYRSAESPWPATLDDARDGYAVVGTGRHAALVDRSRLAVAGHSAGGHLALWLARNGEPRPRLVVAQAPVADLRLGSRQRLGGGAVDALLGGALSEDRLAAADPLRQLPTGVRSVLVHGRGDDVVPVSQSKSYLAAATAAGDACTLETYDGGHYEHLDPASEAVRLLVEALETL